MIIQKTRDIKQEVKIIDIKEKSFIFRFNANFPKEREGFRNLRAIVQILNLKKN